jgi:hypothetical protein
MATLRDVHGLIFGSIVRKGPASWIETRYRHTSQFLLTRAVLPQTGSFPTSVMRLGDGHIVCPATTACCLLCAAFLLGLLFDSRSTDDMFLRNVSSFSLDYTALYSIR